METRASLDPPHNDHVETLPTVLYGARNSWTLAFMIAVQGSKKGCSCTRRQFVTWTQSPSGPGQGSVPCTALLDSGDCQMSSNDDGRTRMVCCKGGSFDLSDVEMGRKEVVPGAHRAELKNEHIHRMDGGRRGSGRGASLLGSSVQGAAK